MTPEIATYHKTQSEVISSKWKDYKELIKLRLNLTVVLSTFLGYLIASGTEVVWFDLFVVCFGGILTVGAANGLNQIIERESDKLMDRTQNRPIVQGRMSVNEALIVSFLMGAVGVFLIGHYLNWLCSFFSFISLMLYAFAYTLLKKISPIAVHIGAIPGAISPLIGYVAFTGKVDTIAISLFVIQFIWQFPHFYSIAWILDEDYKKAGLKLMPLGAKKDRNGAIQIAIFTFLLIPISFLPLYFEFGSWISVIGLLFLGLYIFSKSIQLVINTDNLMAKKLMFSAFIYLPLAFILLLIDKLI